MIYFAGATKGVILSPTLTRQIAAIHGDDTEAWSGKRVQLYPDPMRVAGKDRVAIRARPAPNGPALGAPEEVLEPPPSLSEAGEVYA